MAEGTASDQVAPAVAVAGASAGGVQELMDLVALLPERAPLALLVVLHLSPRSPSVLARILDRRSPWPVVVPGEGQRLEPGRVFVAPPDQHLVVVDGHVRLNREPRENGHRPALDTALRSVARTYGSRAAGIVLSGTGSDGALGLREVRRAGGLTLVHDPAECLYDGMPEAAIAAGPVDQVAPLSDLMGALLAFAGRPPAEVSKSHHTVPQEPTAGVRELSCPDCGGVLLREADGEVEHWTCRVGHRYGIESLEEEQQRALEQALWAAVRGLEERADLLARLARRRHDHGSAQAGERLEAEAAQALDRAAQIRAIVSRPIDMEAAP